LVVTAAGAARQAQRPFPQDFQTTLEILAERGTYPAMENPRSTKDRYKFLCPLPGHQHDTDPSFWVHSDGIRWKCFPCDEGGGPAKLIELLGGGPIPRIPKNDSPHHKPKPAAKKQERPTGCTLEQLAEAKGLPIQHLRNLGWRNTQWYGIPAVAIPYPNGERLRVALEGKNRFRWQKDSSPSLYGADQLRDTDRVVLLVEGETDLAAGTFLGIPTVGVPGVGTWKPQWAKDLEGREVVVWQEPGEAGQNLVDAQARDIPRLRVIEAPLVLRIFANWLTRPEPGPGTCFGS
jgi:hypothetical protein